MTPHRALNDDPCDIAVVMPVLNAQDTITEQLEALSRQTYSGNWELIIADNGSRDRSTHIALAYRDRLQLRIVNAHHKRGAAHARNTGTRATNAPLLAFVDADDVVADDWLEHITQALANHPAVASRFDKELLNPPEVRSTRNLTQTQRLSQHNYAKFLPHAGGSGLAVHRTIHDQIGGFDERLLHLQDTDYCWRIQLAGHTLHYEPAALLHVRFRPTGIASLAQAFRYGRYNGILYHRYRPHGMTHVPYLTTLKELAAHTLRLANPRDPITRTKRLRTTANLTGILLGRLEAHLRRP